MTEVMAIRPYWHTASKCWVFDDPTHGLVAEAFVLGISEMIDDFLEENDMPARKSFTMLFSRNPMPGYKLQLNKLNEEYGGCWYERQASDDDKPRVPKGWLCGAMFKYFSAAPENIYIAIRP